MTAPPKVTASATGITAAIALVIVFVLQTWVFHAPVPADVATLVATVVAPLLVAAAGYLAHKHAGRMLATQPRRLPVIGYLVDGKLYHPADVTIMRRTPPVPPAPARNHDHSGPTGR
jgi:hypothetical protein